MLKSIDLKQLILSLLVCLGACAALDVAHLTGNEGRSELQAIITATKGEPIEPQQMLEVLKRYRETFGKYDYENVRSMIDVAHVDQSKCNGPAFRNINEQLEKRRNWSLNMVPYLIDAKRRLFKVCRDELSHKMLESIEELSKKQVLQLDSIMKGVQEVRQSPQMESIQTIDDWHEQIKSALLTWVRRQIDLKTMKDSESFGDKKRSEFSSCYSVIREFTGPIQVYEAVMDDPDIVSLIDSPTLNWILKYDLCTSIIDIDLNMLDFDEEPKKKSKSLWKSKLFKRSQKS